MSCLTSWPAGASLAQYSRAMPGCYLKISPRTPSLWSWARAHWSSLRTPPRPQSSFSFQRRMKGWLRERWRQKKEGGKHSPWPSLACFFFCFSFPSMPSVSCLQHDTSAQLGSAILEVCVCVCIIVGFMISCYANAASHLCWYKLAHVLSCDWSVI